MNQRGRELLDLCKVNDMIISNGRKIGDLFGKYTSHQWNGSALTLPGSGDFRDTRVKGGP